MSVQSAHSLREAYLELRDDGSVARITLTPEFWPDLMSGKRNVQGRMITAFQVSEDTAHWERHPAGDEVLLLLSGAVTVVLEDSTGDQRYEISAGQAFTVPRGCWHRIEVREAGELVFVTAGAGTEHKPMQESACS